MRTFSAVLQLFEYLSWSIMSQTAAQLLTRETLSHRR